MAGTWELGASKAADTDEVAALKRENSLLAAEIDEMAGATERAVSRLEAHKLFSSRLEKELGDCRRQLAKLKAPADGVSPELWAVARAVVEGDQAAALALFDAMLDLTERGVAPAPVLGEVMASSPRIRAALCRARVGSLTQLLAMTAGDLRALGNFGKDSLRKVRLALARHGLKLKGDA